MSTTLSIKVSKTSTALAEYGCKEAALGKKRLAHSVRMLARILQAYKEGRFTLAVAFTQSGKSGLQLALMHCLPRLLKAKTIGVIWVTNKSSQTLIEQNTGALPSHRLWVDRQPGVFSNKLETVSVIPLMLSGGAVRKDGSGRIEDAEDTLAAIGVHRIVIIMDEVQIGVGHKSQISRLVARQATDTLQESYPVFGFTATPDIFLEGSIDQTVPVVVVPIEPGVGYVGINELLETRIKVFDGFNSHISKLMPRGGGYILLRLSVKNFHEDLEIVQGIANARKASCTVFACDDADVNNRVLPISQLKPTLGQDPGPRQHFLVIKAAMGAGDDLTKLDTNEVNLRKHILAVFEDRFTQTMAATQAVGRWTGYHKDTFPIFVSQRTYDALQQHVHQMHGIVYRGELPAPEALKAQHTQYVSQSRRFVVGDYDDYLRDRPLQNILYPKRSTADNRRTFRDAVRGKSANGSQSFIDFEKVPTDSHELMCYTMLKADYGLKPGQGLWFQDLVPLVRKTKTTLNPLQEIAARV